LKLTDFWIGQKVLEYELKNGHRGRLLRELYVTKIGRRYLSVAEKLGTRSADWERFELVNPDDDFLHSDYDILGNRTMLIPGDMNREDHDEVVKLKMWFKKAATHSKIEKYTYEQLLKVKAILEA